GRQYRLRYHWSRRKRCRHFTAASSSRSCDFGAPAPPPGPRRTEERSRRKALWHRRGAPIKCRSGACASPAAQAAGRWSQRGDSYRARSRLFARRDEGMSFGDFRSLQVRLAVRLAVLYVAAAVIAVGALVYQAYDTAGSLNDRELSLRAEDLARAMVTDSAGQPRLNLPSKLATAYAAAPEDDLFAIRHNNGRLVAAPPAEFGDRVSKWPPAMDEPNYFRLSGAGSEDFGSETYYGLSIALQTAAGPMWISVARTEGSDALIR